MSDAKIEQFKSLRTELVAEYNVLSDRLAEMEARRTALYDLLFNPLSKAEEMAAEAMTSNLTLDHQLFQENMAKAKETPVKVPRKRVAAKKTASKPSVKKEVAKKVAVQKGTGIKTLAPDRIDHLVMHLEKHPGSDKQAIIKALGFDDKHATNTLAAARKRGLIENKGSKPRPKYHLKKA